MVKINKFLVLVASLVFLAACTKTSNPDNLAAKRNSSKPVEYVVVSQENKKDAVFIMTGEKIQDEEEEKTEEPEKNKKEDKTEEKTEEKTEAVTTEENRTNSENAPVDRSLNQTNENTNNETQTTQETGEEEINGNEEGQTREPAQE